MGVGRVVHEESVWILLDPDLLWDPDLYSELRLVRVRQLTAIMLQALLSDLNTTGVEESMAHYEGEG